MVVRRTSSTRPFASNITVATTFRRSVRIAHFTQVDHTFRFKAITGFDPKRSAVSADVDHREQGADEGLVSRGVGGRQAA